MLHELLLSLLGITGEIIVQNHQTLEFAIRDGFDLLAVSEREQIQKIVPLGAFYKYLTSFVRMHDNRWGVCSSKVYIAAFCSGLEDILDRYTRDVAFVERIANVEGPLPLSFLHHHLQKVPKF